MVLSSSHWWRVGHSRYCLNLSHRFEQKSVQRSCQLSFAGPEGGILSFAILSLSLSLFPPQQNLADGASIFFSFTFTVIATTQQSIQCATVSHACFNSLFLHLHWSNFTVDWYQYRHDEFPKRKIKKKKNIYVSPCVTLSLFHLVVLDDGIETFFYLVIETLLNIYMY